VCNIRLGNPAYSWFNDDDRREWDRLGIPWTGKRVIYENQDRVLAAVAERPGEQCRVYVEMTGLTTKKTGKALANAHIRGLVRKTGPATKGARWWPTKSV
jgi:hypothetical protein